MKLFARAILVTSATAACSTSGNAPPVDASPVMTPGDATVTSSLEASTGEAAADGDAHTVALPAGVLASGQHTPIGIALDATHVYWMNLGTYSETSGTYSGAKLMMCAKAGCGNAPTVLASGPWDRTTRLAVSGGNIYWAAYDLLLSCPTGGCAGGPTMLWSGHLVPTDIAVDATGIYFGNSTDNELLTCPLDGCGTNPSVLWSSSVPPAAIALDGASVYFATTGISLLSCGPSGCAPLVVGGTPTTITAGGTNVYVGTRAEVSTGAVASCPEADCPGGLKLVSSDLSYCAGIAVDASDIYFTDWGATDVEGGPMPGGAGRVSKCPIAGCNDIPTPLAGFVNFPQQIAVDEANVYWTDFGSSTDPHSSDDGRVMAMPK